jgi:hypothetical protein
MFGCLETQAGYERIPNRHEPADPKMNLANNSGLVDVPEGSSIEYASARSIKA